MIFSPLSVKSLSFKVGVVFAYEQTHQHNNILCLFVFSGKTHQGSSPKTPPNIILSVLFYHIVVSKHCIAKVLPEATTNYLHCAQCSTYCRTYLFLVAGSPVNSGSFEVKLSVNLDGGAKDISHDHPVGFSIVHGQPVHPQVLRQQGLPLSSNRMLGEKK